MLSEITRSVILTTNWKEYEKAASSLLEAKTVKLFSWGRNEPRY
jgi:hypothetical protein